MRIIFFLLALSLLFPIGCNRNRPEGLNNLNPATVTVVDGDRPLADVYVSLHSKTPRGTWGFGAMTDQNGKARIKTKIRGYTGLGVPVGDYAVTLNTPIPMPSEMILSYDDREKLSPAQVTEHQKKVDRHVDSHRLFSKTISSERTTPLALTVEGKPGTELRVDISQYPISK